MQRHLNLVEVSVNTAPWEEDPLDSRKFLSARWLVGAVGVEPKSDV